MTLPDTDPNAPLDARSLSRLRWRCRRGLLENDLFIERFFFQHGDQLTVSQAQGLDGLMALADNDLLDGLLGRRSAEELGLDVLAQQMLQTLRETRGSAIGAMT